MSNLTKLIHQKKILLLLVAAILYLVSFIVTLFYNYANNPTRVQEKLSKSIQKKERSFEGFLANKQIIESIIYDTLNNTNKNNLQEYNYGIYIYKQKQQPELIYWNNNNYSIAKSDILKNDNTFIVRYQNGIFECIKQTINIHNNQFIVAALLPIHRHFFIENKYLKSAFDEYPEFDDYYEITNNSNGYSITNTKGNSIYTISKKAGANNTNYNLITILLRIAAIVCLFFYLHFLCLKTLQKKGFNKAFLLLSTVLILLRTISYFINFPFNFSQLPLFDPSVYASNFLHPSLGDLLINCILIFWLIIFYKVNCTLKNSALLFIIRNKKLQKIVPYIHLVALVIITFLCTSTIKSLVLDSKVSLDVTNFFSLTWFSIVSFIILCFCVLIFYHLSHLLLNAVFNFQISLFKQLLIIALAGLALLSNQLISVSATSNLLTILWLLIYVVIINFRKVDTSIYLLHSTFFIFWILFFSINVAALLMLQNNYIETEQRKKWAEELAEKIDPNSETLLKIATTNFNDEFLQHNFHRFQEEFSNKFIKDSLVNENFSGYLNKYDTRIYTFDCAFNPLFNDDSLPFSVIRTIVLNQSKSTTIANLHSFEDAYQKENYLYEKNIVADSGTLGYLFVIVKPKQYKSEAIYPELFKQVKDLSNDFNIHYAYAIYNNGALINSFNNYNFPFAHHVSKTPSGKYKIIKQGSYKELWYSNQSGKTVVIVKKSSTLLELFTLFAYLFCTFLILVALLHIASFLIKTRLKKEAIKQVLQFKISTQIQAIIIMISLFSFIVIGVTTISFFIYRFNQTNQERLSKTIQVMANQVEEKLKTTTANLAFDDMVDITTLGFGNSLEKVINDVSEIYNTDINLYNNTGTLIASTQPYIYNKQLLSEKMNPIAFETLNKNKSVRFIQSESIANFKYLSIYLPVNDSDGNTYAFINIPFLNSQAELNQEISGFLSTLMNLNAFIFLLAGAIAYMATNKITASFSLIGNKMKAINFEHKNETIEWKRNDEIGILVNEYNKMVLKLEASAKALAKSEREGAWREMARQVAHEIKNPLTPMKLSIQYLQKSIETNQINTPELIKNVSKTLIEQIEQLARIASDFSQFANIENTQPEVFNVSEIIASLIKLYNTREDVHFVWHEPSEDFLIYADKSQISRLLKNLISNAIEAGNENKQVEIMITQLINNNNIEIAIKDNGTGIDEALKQKLFTPNFTTKSSGTGLGLAICKGIVERANGTISFTTQKNIGTTFFISLPRA